ncbi:MAG: zinc-binding dehydrogenase [Caldilineaceae bacterium]|nr:zinc-binding dehydrogenase [Caldilineaceae bacterium]
MLAAIRPTIRTISPVFSMKPLPRTMMAAVIDSPRKVYLKEVALPWPKAGEVLIQIEGCGVCPCDLPVWEGHGRTEYPLTPGHPGHEGWGWVAAVGPDVTNVLVGDRVATLSQGAFAEYVLANSEEVARLPASLGTIPFPSAILSQAMNVFQRSRVRDGDRVAVVGVGILGALLTNLAASAGAEVIALSRRPFTLDLARFLGAAHTLSLTADPEQIIDYVESVTGGKRCKVVFEAVGKQTPLNLATELTAFNGQLIIAGYHQDGLRQINLQMWHQRGLEVINAHTRNPQMQLEGLELAVEAATAGKLDPASICTHIFGLAELGDALAMTRQRPDGFLKAMIML